MKIQYCSDLHLEFTKNKQYLLENPLTINGEILILAGDITLLKKEYLKNPFFDYVSENYSMIFWVPGNHEYYKNNLKYFKNRSEIEIRKNVLLVNNCVINYKDVRFLFTTLWSKITQFNEKIIERSVADFSLISFNDRLINSSNYNMLHKECMDFLEKELGENKGKTAVVTHHLPSYLCNTEEYKNSQLNDAFCVELHDFIEKHQADYWIYGHSHFNQKSLKIGKTTLLTNQLGYVHLHENINYRNDASFTI